VLRFRPIFDFTKPDHRGKIMSDLKAVLKQLGLSDELADAFAASDLAQAVKVTRAAMDGGPQYHDVSNMTLSRENFLPMSSPR
jgi:hypothetical protein